MKKAIIYLRYSSEGQSHHSIERQQIVCDAWVNYHHITVVDTFTDDGYSARNFDRPDIKQLFSFIRKNSSQIDYLVVSELTRFSRETGDAINMVKDIQKQYGIRIVSASRSQVYDCNDSNSFFMMGLEFLLGNSENIKRQNDINGGIYTAKTQKGRYIGSKPPYGYIKAGPEKDRHLVPHPDQAAVVRFIFNAYLSNTPIAEIKKQAKQKGFHHTGSDSITQVLTNPVHMGFQLVKPWKDLPGGLFPLHDHENIIDPQTWYAVQNKLKAPAPNTSLREDMPLRSLLKCHCGHPLTGAHSTGKSGKKFPYYNCKQRGHVNVNANKAHDQLQQVLELLSMPDYMIQAIRHDSEVLMKEKLKEQQVKLQSAKRELEKTEADLKSVEQKWISNEMPADTFHRWYNDLTSKRISLSADIRSYSRSEEEKWFLLTRELEKLTDMRYLYNNIPLTDKRELLRQVFDNSLYYQSATFRTPYLMETFTHNALILKQKHLLIIDKWDYQNADNPIRWSPQVQSRTLPDLLSFLHNLKVA